MLKKILISTAILIVFVAYAWSVDFTMPALDKINKAFPVNQAVISAKDAFTYSSEVSEASLASFTNKYQHAMNLRALTCSAGREIGKFDSIESIKKMPFHQDCFTKEDKKIESLIKVLHLAQMLSLPAKRTAFNIEDPVLYPSAYVVRTAPKSGVTVTLNHTHDPISYDMASNAKIADLSSMKGTQAEKGGISDNGRVLYAPTSNGSVRFVDTESGNLLWEASEIGDIYAFLPKINAMLILNTISGSNQGSPRILDLNTGEMKDYDYGDRKILWAIPTKVENQLLVGSYNSISYVDHERSQSGINIKVTNKLLMDGTVRMGTFKPLLMLDGKALLFTTNRTELALYDMDTRKTKVVLPVGLLVSPYYAKLNEEAIAVDLKIKQDNGQYTPYQLNIGRLVLNKILNPQFDIGNTKPLDSGLGYARIVGNGIWVGKNLKLGDTELLQILIAQIEEKKEAERRLREAEMKKRMEEINKARSRNQSMRNGSISSPYNAPAYAPISNIERKPTRWTSD